MRHKKLFSIAAVLAALSLSACGSSDASGASIPETTSTTTTTTTTAVSGDEIRVSYIDVGQGDSEFIELPNGETLLIDAGTNETGANAVSYIQSLGYTSIDYVVGTHPHEDHIGGLDDIINTFDIGAVYMPKATANTKTFEDVLDAVEAKGLTINTAKAGVTLIDTDGLTVTMLAPVSETYDDTNNYSAVIRIVYGDTSFLFTGDAETQVENEITADVSAGVLKVGHHGSYTSTSEDFLDRVSPSIAIISCGKDNSYGHPHAETIEKLTERGIDYYRTDELGTIVVTSDGVSYSVSTADGSTVNEVAAETNTSAGTTTASADTSSSTSSGSVTYVLNTNSKKIHYESCSSVQNISEANKAYTTDYDQAISEGYVPCGSCNPEKE